MTFCLVVTFCTLLLVPTSTADLSEAEVQAAQLRGTSEKQKKIDQVLTKIFQNYSVSPGAAASQTLRNRLSVKLWRMGKMLSKVGGPKRNKILCNWKTSDWSLIIDSPSLQRENDAAAEKLKEMELRVREADQEVKKLQSEVRVLKQLNENSVTQSTSSRPGCRISKKWQDYSRQHKIVKKKQISADVTTALSSCKSTKPLTPTTVHFATGDENESMVLDLNKGKFISHSSTTSMNNENCNKSSAVLYVKEKFAISDRAYHEISLISHDLPRKNDLKKLSEIFDHESRVLSCPNGITGVQQSLQDRLHVRLQNILKTRSKIPTKVRVKLSGDGTNVARSMHIINFTFTVLEEMNHRNSPAGNHTLAILKTSEKYECLAAGLADICREIESCSIIEFNGKLVEIEYYLTGDWKFLALVTGIDAANSRYSCLWCKCPKEDRHRMDMEWSLIDTDKGARTVEETLTASSLPKSKRKYNVSAQPLFPKIPLKRVVIDPLHLFLRVTDNLTNLLITELRRLDSLKQANYTDKESCQYRYELFL